MCRLPLNSGVKYIFNMNQGHLYQKLNMNQLDFTLASRSGSAAAIKIWSSAFAVSTYIYFRLFIYIYRNYWPPLIIHPKINNL